MRMHTGKIEKLVVHIILYAQFLQILMHFFYSTAILYSKFSVSIESAHQKINRLPFAQFAHNILLCENALECFCI